MKMEKAIRDHIAECLRRVEVIKENMDSMALNKETCEHNIANLKKNVLALEAYLEYRKVGTVTEFRELKERDTAKKPMQTEEGMVCPMCGNKAYPWNKFCDACGQRWWEE